MSEAKNASELLTCPFCGGRGSMSKSYDPDGSGAFHYIQCRCCRAKSPEFYASDTCPVFFEQVRDGWNIRADLHAAAIRQARNEALREAAELIGSKAPFTQEQIDNTPIMWQLDNIHSVMRSQNAFDDSAEILAMIDKED